MFHDVTFWISAAALFTLFILNGLSSPPDATANFLSKLPMPSRILFGIIKIAMWQLLHAWSFSAWGVTGGLFVCFFFAFIVVVTSAASWTTYFKRLGK